MRIRILLAAQASAERHVITRMLDRLGCDWETADNGFQAVEALRSGTFDLVFVDRDVPLVDAIETTHLIRENFGKVKLPIIGLFPDARDSAIGECRVAGMNDHIIKPIALYKFQDALDRFVHLTEPAATLPELAQAINI